MNHAAKFVMAGALLAAASLSVRAETAPVPTHPVASPFADAQSAADFHQAMRSQQDKAFEAQRQFAEEMAQRFAQTAPQMPGQAMPYGQSQDEVRAQMQARHDEMRKQMDEQRKQAEAMAAQYRQAAFGPTPTQVQAQAQPTPAVYPFSNENRPLAPVMDPAFDPAKVQARYEESRKQMEAYRAERVKWAEEQRKAAEEQHAAMRKEMEAFRSNRKI